MTQLRNRKPGGSRAFSITAGGERSVNAVWIYELPFEAVALITGYIASYSGRVAEIGESPTA
ncbi:DUF427 domain-containing protein [Edaphobacter aggregans]|uniref:DUF427 domain-containing protein n=1 Tax=Edaphobacter aggregans TaxID=570835 RepID=UPI003CCC37AB